MKFRIVSGGQTGVDRAALDVALSLPIPCGGWCPKGRRAEDGTIPDRYPLEETPSADYQQRTEWNVRDSDGTLVLCMGKPSGGTALTIKFVRKHERPCLIIDLASQVDFIQVAQWIKSEGIRPGESKHPGIHDKAMAVLREVLAEFPG